MIKPILGGKLGQAALVAATVITVGSIATVSAAKGPDHDQAPTAQQAGYDKDQCKHGGWKNFHNPDGSPMFKNQGQCVSFFAKQQGHDD